jgi:AraC family transcriptional regulator
MSGAGDLYLAEQDGRSPTRLAAGAAPGESGVSILSLRFRGGACLRTTPQDHLVWIQMSPRARFECRIAEHGIRHEPRVGSLAICPAGADCAAVSNDDVDAVLVAVAPAQLALAAAEASVLGATLMERLTVWDGDLAELARVLVAESGSGYPNGALFWHDVASAFIDSLLGRHTSIAARPARGALGEAVLGRLRDYVHAHLDEPIKVEALASLAASSPFHFTRVFTRSVGVTPHRYVVHLRLRRAVEMVREGRVGFAEIAASTGFADQSHLSRWMRRVHGVSLRQLAA